MPRDMRPLIFTILLFCSGSAAYADIDYRCLGDCKNSGRNTRSCMEECTYIAPDAAIPEEKPEGHKEFVAPQKMESGKFMIEAEPLQLPSGASVTTNHACVQDCIKEKLQYSFCAQRCTTLHK